MPNEMGDLKPGLVFLRTKLDLPKSPLGLYVNLIPNKVANVSFLSSKGSRRTRNRKK